MNTKDPRTRKMVHKKLGWKSELSSILFEHNNKSASGKKIVGDATMRRRSEVLYAAFTELWELGFRIENPRNFREIHMAALGQHWEDKKLKPATIQNRISVLRVFTEWIGKANMLKESTRYVTNAASVERDQVAREDKGWKAKEIDMVKVMADIAAYDEYVAMQLYVAQAFGLRREEAVCFRPHLAHRDSGADDTIKIVYGTKGGRDRLVTLSTGDQWYALEVAKRFVGTTRGHLGRPGFDLKQNLKRFSNVMHKFGITKKALGVTAHGLRHDFANDIYERVTGKPSPVRGGLKKEVDPHLDYLGKVETSSQLGHSRTSITTAYYGSHRNKKNKSKDLAAGGAA